jgi:hypothetical protein
MYDVLDVCVTMYKHTMSSLLFVSDDDKCLLFLFLLLKICRHIFQTHVILKHIFENFIGSNI